MTRTAARRGDGEDGVILVLFAVAMLVLIGIAAIAVDGSFGFVQNRRAQNATDFAAFAASQQLDTSIYCNGASDPSTQDIAGIIQQLVTDNDAGVGTNWSAEFVDQNGNVIPDPGDPGQPDTFSPGNDTGAPPPGACGVDITAKPVWAPFFAGIFGVHQLKGYASGTVAETPTGSPIGILALNKVGPHEILGGGTGTFVVSGAIFLNSEVNEQPWSSSFDNYWWDDAIDAKTDSNLYVYGTITTSGGTYNNEPLMPLDHCFQDAPPTFGGSGSSYNGSDPPNPLPKVQLSCSDNGGSVTVDYNQLTLGTSGQISDPLLEPSAPADPVTSSNIGCPGNGGPVTYTSVSPSATTLKPGIYTQPVELTGSVDFEDCQAYADSGAYPGVYIFQQGLWINPQSSGDTVTGTNVVITSEEPYPMLGNTLNGTTAAANGAPCLPADVMSSGPSGAGAQPQHEVDPGMLSQTSCGGGSPALHGVQAYTDYPIQEDTSLWGTGNNFSVMIGGVPGSTVSLQGPTTGPYAGTDGSPGIVLYQYPGVQANDGFDAEAGDGSTVSLTGVVYNASLTDYGADAPQDYWDGQGGGVPFYAGGTLQTGFGTGWTGSDAPAASSGSVTVSGTAIVDDFNTDGATAISILGKPYNLPGGSELSLIG